jgi:hypothetical protein
MQRRVVSRSALALFLLAGCTGGTGPAPEGEDAFTRYPEAETQILAIYANQGAGERRQGCGPGHIEQIDASRIYADRPIEVILVVDYRFAAPNAGAGPCSGSARGWFTFDREADGRLALAEMSDQSP